MLVLNIDWDTWYFEVFVVLIRSSMQMLGYCLN